MANALYDKGRNKFARGEINWLSGGDTIRVGLVKSAYTPNLSSHEFWTDLGANIIGDNAANTRAACKQITLSDPTDGVCDGGDVTFSTVTAGNTINYLAIFKDSGVDGTSPLIALIDTATGLPLTTTGGDVPVTWDNGANKIFKL